MNYAIRVLENDRIAARGLARIGQGVGLTLDETDRVRLTVDWSAFLGGADTIANVVNSATGATVSGASNTTTTATFLVQTAHSAIVEHRITTAGGITKELPIFINGTEGFYGERSYYE